MAFRQRRARKPSAADERRGEPLCSTTPYMISLCYYSPPRRLTLFRLVYCGRRDIDIIGHDAAQQSDCRRHDSFEPLHARRDMLQTC